MKYINHDITIDFPVPECLRYIMEQAEEADAIEDEGNYIAFADQIDIIAKNCCADGAITEKQWALISCRYP